MENASARAQHGESWKLVYEITERRTAKKGMMKGNSREDRVKKWYDHFSNLLGKEPIIDGNGNNDIPRILNDLNIDDAPFTIEE